MATLEAKAPSRPTMADANRDITRPIARPEKRFFLVLGVAAAGVALMFGAWFYQIGAGIGVAGITHPVFWGVYITTFVFWVGIAHSGTLISAILYLFRSGWRTTINRTAEAMTIFAVMTAGLFPLIHLGRVWYFYYLMPYPSQRQIWPDFRSPLVMDVFAVSTYLVISALFWYTGLIPDFAVLRDRAKGWAHKIYGAFSLGWQGTVSEWRHYRRIYLYMAGIATPLVLSVHSVVSWDFALAIVPGWHSTIFAPYFVAGAIFSGVALVITLMIPLRWAFGLEAYITEKHFENMAKLVLLTSLIVGFCVRDGVLPRLLLGRSDRARELPLAGVRRLRASLLGHGVLQCGGAAGAMVQEDANDAAGTLRAHDLREHRDVVRALRDHRDLARPRVRTGGLGALRTELGGAVDPRRQLLLVLLLVPPLLAQPAGDLHRRGEGTSRTPAREGARKWANGPGGRP